MVFFITKRTKKVFGRGIYNNVIASRRDVETFSFGNKFEEEYEEHKQLLLHDWLLSFSYS